MKMAIAVTRAAYVALSDIVMALNTAPNLDKLYTTPFANHGGDPQENTRRSKT